MLVLTSSLEYVMLLDRIPGYRQLPPVDLFEKDISVSKYDAFGWKWSTVVEYKCKIMFANGLGQ
jgi:hypothetical protein